MAKTWGDGDSSHLTKDAPDRMIIHGLNKYAPSSVSGVKMSDRGAMVQLAAHAASMASRRGVSGPSEDGERSGGDVGSIPTSALSSPCILAKYRRK